MAFGSFYTLTRSGNRAPTSGEQIVRSPYRYQCNNDDRFYSASRLCAIRGVERRAFIHLFFEHVSDSNENRYIISNHSNLILQG